MLLVLYSNMLCMWHYEHTITEPTSPYSMTGLHYMYVLQGAIHLLVTRRKYCNRVVSSLQIRALAAGLIRTKRHRLALVPLPVQLCTCLLCATAPTLMSADCTAARCLARPACHPAAWQPVCRYFRWSTLASSMWTLKTAYACSN